jgi:8-amino-7-oxononanoate synthase
MAQKLTRQIKDALIQRALQGRLEATEDGKRGSIFPTDRSADDEFLRFDRHPAYRQLEILRTGGERFGIPSPFFLEHEGIAGAHTRMQGRSLINFAHYNYLALAGHERVQQAAKEAIDRYGTSVSASRIVAGERPFHRALERALAEFYGVDDALALVSGHATNVSVIGHLLGSRDLILHDEYAHNSIVLGAQLAGAQRLSFPHGDYDALETLLRQHRPQAERALLVVEGVYSMDGDIPDLPRLLELKHRYRCWLMVDEAHSLGVLGPTGRGLAEHFSLPSTAVDIWMGTLSKTLASCGGYVAGEQALIDNLRHFAPGFLYSVGMAPAVAAAAHTALEILQEEPQRVRKLQANGQAFLAQAKELGLDVGSASGHAIIPWRVGGSLQAVRMSAALLDEGIHVQPILYPAVPERQARLRFFLSSGHTATDYDSTFAAIRKLWR